MPRNKTSLLILIPSLAGGGAERILLNILNQLDPNKYNITLFCCESRGVLWGDVPDYVEKRTLGLPIFIIKIAVFLYRNYGFNTILKAIGSKVVGKFDCGVSFLDSVYTNFLFDSPASIDFKIAVIHSSYSSYSNRSNFIQGNHFNRMTHRFNSMDKIVCVSGESLKEFRAIFGQESKSVCIYNPINRNDILLKSGGDAPIFKHVNKVRIIAVGSLIPVKGYDLLIKAVKEIQTDTPFEVHILGDGYLRSELSDLIEQSGLRSCVFLEGFQRNPYSWLNHSDIFVMSSISEGLPTVLCEAMILGKPCVVPDITGCREVSGDGEFALIYKRDVQNLADSLAKLIEDADLRIQYEGKALKRAEIFDDETAIKKYEELFTSTPYK